MATSSKFFKNAEELAKDLKNHKSSYLKDIKTILHECLTPFFEDWHEKALRLRAKHAGGEGQYSVYKPSQLVVALRKSRSNFRPSKFKTPRGGYSDAIGYFYVPALFGDNPPKRNLTLAGKESHSQKRVLEPKSYYQMLEWGIEPHSLGRGNITRRGSIQRIATKTLTSKHNKGYYLRVIDTLQDRIARKKKQIAELQGKPQDEVIKVRKGGGYVYSTVGKKIAQYQQQIEKWTNGKNGINDYRQRWNNVNKWSSGGAHEVTRTPTNRFWRGKRYQKSLGGAQFMQKARKSVANDYTKRFVRDKFLKWIQSKVEECKK